MLSTPPKLVRCSMSISICMNEKVTYFRVLARCSHDSCCISRVLTHCALVAILTVSQQLTNISPRQSQAVKDEAMLVTGPGGLRRGRLGTSSAKTGSEHVHLHNLWRSHSYGIAKLASIDAVRCTTDVQRRCELSCPLYRRFGIR